jgi:outer membrane receptor protein involved in Fe transport
MRLAIFVAPAVIILSAAAANGQGKPAGAPPVATPIGQIEGRLADSTSGAAVASGSITIRRQGDTTFVGGALPKADGTFRVDGLAPGQYTLRFRAIGYAPVTMNGLVVTDEKPVVNVGTLKLNIVATKLADQEVKAERDEQQLSPDRNSYSVKNMTTAAGGTAIDVLRNIPLVEVDGSNRVSLRSNSNVVIQINGRSTPLKGDQLAIFLAQLPASMVKTVEVATNPSAKDDPEGTAGILNIILKQDVELGLSGGINAGTATTGQVNASGNIGKQQGKFTGFFSANVYRDNRRSSGTTSRTNLVVPSPVFIETDLSGRQHPLSGGSTLRTEYRFNEIDALTFDAFFFGGNFAGNNASYYTNLDGARAVIGAFNQFSENSSRYVSQSYNLAFRRQGKPNTPQLTVEAEYGANRNSNQNDLSGELVKADATTPASIPIERDETEGRFPYLNTKLDYSRPLNRNAKLETGFKAIWRVTENDFTASYLNGTTHDYEVDPVRTSGFDYKENIVGAYALYSQRISKAQLQAGFRLEDANTHFNLPSVARQFDKEYWSKYPSAILSYNFSDLRQVKVSYSRRVSRPNPWQLNPIEFRQDTRNVFHGNPDLGAEYTNSFDFALQDGHKWGSIQLSPYVRMTNHAVRDITFIDSAGVLVRTFANVANTRTMGADLNISYRRGPLQLYGGGSASRYKSDASNLAGNPSAQDIIWSSRANATWKFTTLFDVQMFANYRAPYKTEGGSQLANGNVAASARYKIWGDKGNVSVRFSDPFKLQRYGYRTANGSVVEYSRRYNGSRAIFVTVTRNFGQALKLRSKSDPDVQPVGPPGG